MDSWANRTWARDGGSELRPARSREAAQHHGALPWALCCRTSALRARGTARSKGWHRPPLCSAPAKPHLDTATGLGKHKRRKRLGTPPQVQGGPWGWSSGSERQEALLHSEVAEHVHGLHRGCRVSVEEWLHSRGGRGSLEQLYKQNRPNNWQEIQMENY